MNGSKNAALGLVIFGAIASGCATVKIPKSEIVQMFRMCGDEHLVALNDSLDKSCTDESVKTFGQIKHVNASGETSSRRLVMKYEMGFGSKIYFRDRDHIRRRVNVDQNSGLVLFDSSGNTDRLYLANSTFLYGNCLTGAKSRLLGWNVSSNLKDIAETGIYDEAPFNYFHEVEPTRELIDSQALSALDDAFGKSDSVTFAFRNMLCDEDSACFHTKREHSNFSIVKFTISKRSTLDSVRSYIQGSGPFLSPDSMPCTGRIAPFGVVSFHSATPYPNITFNLNRRYVSIGSKSAFTGRNIANHIIPFVANAWRASRDTIKRDP
jgi:hypothetical protein